MLFHLDFEEAPMARQFRSTSKRFWSRAVPAVTALVATAILTLPADAQSRRANSTSLTCAQAQSLIAQRGAVLMNTGPNTFDRYVNDRGSCQVNEYAKTDFIPTKDKKKCAVKRCESITPFSVP
jgi:hypothetical protein